MYGFKPRHAQGKPVQNLADGGIVHSIKGALGLRPRTQEELRAADAKSQARNQEAATAAAGRAQIKAYVDQVNAETAKAEAYKAGVQAPAKAISDYSGMLAMQRREKELGLKDGGSVGGFKPGGLIRGPGTGTSDSIKTEKRPGTFIMPADSTQAIGPEALERLGEPEEMEVDDEREMDGDDEEGKESVPVRLSNGEFELPPEQVQALGEAVLTVMRNATHQPVGERGGTPTGKGFTPHQFFAGGGTVQGRTNKFDVEDWANQQEQERSARTQATQAQAQAQVDQNDAGAVARQGAKSPVGMTPGEAHSAGLITSATPVGYNPAYDRRVNGAQGAAESRVAQIPVGSNVPVPAPDGQDSTELTRNVNNGLNALGGMGAVASVPLRAGQAAKAAATGSGATALPSGIPRLTGPAQAAAAPAADFVAGMGPGATTYANTIPRIGNAPTQALPAVNAALQEGAQANVLAAAARTAAGANAAAPDQPANPALAATAQAAPIPATPGGAVFGFYPQLAGGQRTTYATDAKLRTGVQATGPSTFAQATPTEKTIIGGGDGRRMNAAQDPRSLTYGATAGNDTAAPVAPAAPNPTDQRIAAGAQQAPAATTAPTATATAPTTQPASAMVAPGAYRNAPGQYSDNAAGMAMPAGFTGQPSAQNMAAADALAARQTPAGFQPAGSQPAGVQAPVVRNSTNDWAARNALRNAEVSASSITNRPEWQSGSTTQAWSTRSNGVADPQGKVAAYRAAVANDQALQQAQPGMDKAAMDGNTALQREGIQQAGATGRTAMQEQGATAREAGRTALAGEEMGLKRTAAGFQTRALQRVENLQTRYEAEKDPAKRSELARQLREIQGKEQPSEWGIQVTPATKNADGSTTEGSVIRYNKATGQAERVDTGANRNSAPYPDGTRLNGKDGKAYIVRNGVPVPA